MVSFFLLLIRLVWTLTFSLNMNKFWLNHASYPLQVLYCPIDLDYNTNIFHIVRAIPSYVCNYLNTILFSILATWSLINYSTNHHLPINYFFIIKWRGRNPNWWCTQLVMSIWTIYTLQVCRGFSMKRYVLSGNNLLGTNENNELSG